jgi:glycosyltransferase involved in cell wall biosynthesis
MENVSHVNRKKSLFVLGTLYPAVTGGMEIFNYYFLQYQLGVLKRNILYFSTNCLKNHENKHVKIWSFKPVRLFYPMHLFVVLLKHNSSINFVYTGYARQTWIIPFFSALIFRIFRKPYIVTIHSGGKPVWKPAFAYKYYFNHAFALVGVSEAICEEYAERLGGKEIIYLPPVIPFKRSDKTIDRIKSDLQINAGRKTLLFVGTLKGMKNPDKIIKGFGLSRSNQDVAASLQLIFVGGGDMQEALKQYCKEKSLEDCVFFHGMVPRELIQDYYAIADYYIIGSDYEGTSVSLLEAMYNKIPIIAADSPGINRMLQADRNALLYPAHDPVALAKCIQLLLSDDKLADNLAVQAKRDFDEKYSYEKMIAGYEDIFQSVSGN